MKFTYELDEGIVIVPITGRIMGGDEVTHFHVMIHQYLNGQEVDKCKSFIIDLQNVDWMNNVGLSMLISALTTVRNAGGRLVLCHIEKIKSILTITRLNSVFEHYDSQEDAKASFQPTESLKTTEK